MSDLTSIPGTATTTTKPLASMKRTIPSLLDLEALNLRVDGTRQFSNTRSRSTSTKESPKDQVTVEADRVETILAEDSTAVATATPSLACAVSSATSSATAITSGTASATASASAPATNSRLTRQHIRQRRKIALQRLADDASSSPDDKASLLPNPEIPRMDPPEIEAADHDWNREVERSPNTFAIKSPTPLPLSLPSRHEPAQQADGPSVSHQFPTSSELALDAGKLVSEEIDSAIAAFPEKAITDQMVISAAASSSSATTPTSGLREKQTSSLECASEAVPVVDNTFQFRFAYIRNPACFFVHLFSNSVDDLSVRMNEFYGIYDRLPTIGHGKPFFATERTFTPQIGDLVAELAEDLSYVFRSIVLNRNSRNDTYHLQRVDFGEREWRDIQYIGVLPEAFHSLPPQAIRCCLQGLRPPSNSIIWSSAAISYFRRLVVPSRLYTAYTDAEQLEQDFRVSSVNPVPVVVEDTDDDFVLQLEFVRQGVGVVEYPNTNGRRAAEGSDIPLIIQQFPKSLGHHTKSNIDHSGRDNNDNINNSSKNAKVECSLIPHPIEANVLSIEANTPPKKANFLTKEAMPPQNRVDAPSASFLLSPNTLKSRFLFDVPPPEDFSAGRKISKNDFWEVDNQTLENQDEQVASPGILSRTMSSTSSFEPLVTDASSRSLHPTDVHAVINLVPRVERRLKIPDASFGPVILPRSKYGQWRDRGKNQSKIPIKKEACSAPAVTASFTVAASTVATSTVADSTVPVSAVVASTVASSTKPSPAASASAFAATAAHPTYASAAVSASTSGVTAKAPLPDAPMPEVNPDLQSWNPMEEEWESQRNMYGCDVDDAGVAIDGFVSEQRPVCKYFEMGTCHLNACKDAHVVPLQQYQGATPLSRPTEFVVPVGKELSENPCPSVTEQLGGRFSLQEGEIYAVSVSSVASPSRFSIVLPFGDLPFRHLNRTQPSIARGSFEMLWTEMQVHYGTRGRGNRTRTTAKLLNEADIVAARYPADDKWYRAKIIYLVEDDWGNTTIYVEFCDFGFEAKLDYNDIRDLETHFLYLPFQAVRCRLANVKPALPPIPEGGTTVDVESRNVNNLDNGYVTSSDVDDNNIPSTIDGWSKRAFKFFLRKVEGKPLLGRVNLVIGPHHHIELWDAPQDIDKSLSINCLLKSEGFATKGSLRIRNTDVRRRPSCGSLPQPG